MSELKKIAYMVLDMFIISIFLGCVGAPPMTELKADGKSVYDFITKENYKNWKKWPGTGEMYPRSTVKPSEPHGAFLTTYVNDDTYAAIEGKKGILPDESIIVKENYDPDKKLAAITVMYKEKGYDPTHNDWFWAKYEPNGTIDAEGKVKGCIDCHSLSKDIFKDKTNDYIWSSDLTPSPGVTILASPTATPAATLTVKKSAHYESNTPAHGSVLAGVPVNVVIDFNFDLGPGSTISIKTDDMEYGTGETIIDSNKLAMRRNMDLSAPDGLYTVNYKACWPDGSCHDGHFQFTIERTESGNYTDLRNKTEVTVKLSEIAFKPQNIRISRGTKVIWINEDNVDHYVNTDAHPSHTYYPPQNSKVLKKGDMFSLTFDKAGIYPYHCSAHAMIMTGSVIVE